MEQIRSKAGFICDMDGVLYHGNYLLPGASEFVEWLQRENKKFLFLTNSSERSPRELQLKLARMGIEVTKATFTPVHYNSQFPRPADPAVCYIIGETGLVKALMMSGFP